MLEGCNCLRQSRDYRAPITSKMLDKICLALHSICSSQFEVLLFTAVFSLAYFCLLRVSEVVVCQHMGSQRALSRSDISLESSNAVSICLRVTKTRQTGRPVVIRLPYSADTRQCIDSLRCYMEVMPSRDVQFFCHKNASPLTRYQFSAVLSKVCQHAGLDTSVFKTHGFHIGRATDLALQGYADEKIKLLGRWSSKAFSRYIRL